MAQSHDTASSNHNMPHKTCPTNIPWVGRLAAWWGDTALEFTLAAEEARGGEPRSYGLSLPYMSEVRRLPEFKALMEEINLFNEKLREWEDYYNYHRPHGALNGQTPFERLIAKTRAEVSQWS